MKTDVTQVIGITSAIDSEVLLKQKSLSDYAFYKQGGDFRFESWYTAGVVGTATITPSPIAAADVIYAMPIVIQRSVTIDQIGFNVITGGVSNRAVTSRLALYDCISDQDLYPNNLIYQSGEILTSTTGPKKSVLTTPIKLVVGQIYWICITQNSSAGLIPTLPTITGLSSNSVYPLLGTDNTLGANPSYGLSLSRSYGAFPDVFPVGGTRYNSTTFIPALQYHILKNILYNSIHQFTSLEGGGSSTLVSVGSLLYGTSQSGGSFGGGTLFSFNPISGVVTVLYSYNDPISGSFPTNLLNVGGILYGTCANGGSSTIGTIFSYNISTSTFTILYTLSTVSLGRNPYSGLCLSDSLLYGTCQRGGSDGLGSLFSFNPSTNVFTKVKDFTASTGVQGTGGLLLNNGTLYGTTSSGGGHGFGSIYSYVISSNIFTNLYSLFSNDGSYSSSGLILVGNILYGSTTSGGNNNAGTIFSLNLSGSIFTKLFDLSDTVGSQCFGTLLHNNGTLYGTTNGGGLLGTGTIFTYNIAKDSFVKSYDFLGSSNNDGSSAYYGLMNIGNTMYGTTQNGGTAGYGTIFSITN